MIPGKTLSQEVNHTIKPSLFFDQTSSDTRRLSIHPPQPSPIVHGYHHTRLMLPSERLSEMRRYKDSLTSQQGFKQANAFHTKQRRAVERGLGSEGVAGISSPVNRPDPVFSRRASELAVLDARAVRRHPEPKQEISGHRRVVGAERYLDTHSRLWPNFEPSWTVARALEIYSHDTRERDFNIVSAATNKISGLRVRRN